jgi:hypothetical protein
LADEVEVDGCGEGRGGEEYQPDVDAEFGLFVVLLAVRGRRVEAGVV